MNTIDALQGSDEWLAIRARHYTASEAPAMMGASKYQTRAELLRQKHTGLSADVDSNTQRLFDRGHAAEAAARPIVEARIGESLFPATGSETIDGLPLSASFDGITMSEEICWENKLWNMSLADAVRAEQLEPHYYWQLEQQLLVSGAEKVYFTTSDGTPDGTIGMWYEAAPGRREQLIAGWKQFAEDLANYEHVEQAEPVVAAPIEALPALAVQVTGSISLTHNLDRFGKRLTEFVGSLNSKPETDQDFADLDAAVKVLKEAEGALDAAESNALAQTTMIADMCNLVAMYRKVARDNRLMFEKIVKQEKENRKAEIVVAAKTEFDTHLQKLNARIGGNWMPAMNGPRFADAIKGLKSLYSMRDKVSTALANAKIEANEIADRIEANRKSLDAGNAMGEDYLFLVPDFASVCTKARDDFEALVTSRLSAHRQREEAERERIRREEADRITREAAHADAQAKAQAAQTARDEEAKRVQQDAPQGSVAAAQNVAVAPEAPALSKEPTGEASMPGGSGATGMKGIVPTDLTAQPVSPITDESIIDDFLGLLSIVPMAKKALRPHLLAWEKYRIAREMAAAA